MNQQKSSAFSCFSLYTVMYSILYNTDDSARIILMSQLSLEDICLSFCRDTALEILALRMFRGRETAQFARKRASARRRLSALSHDKNPAHLFFRI